MQSLNLRTSHIVTFGIVALFMFAALPMMTQAAPPKECEDNHTTVKGHCGKESGTVVGHYTAVYAYDANGDWYQDLGDGRVWGNVDSIDELDQDTLTVCDYIINYKGDFGGDPFLDMGSIQNIINCSGYDDNGHYVSNIVHESDPRYRGNPDWSIWGDWEYHTRVVSGEGNLVRPMNHVGS